MSCSRYRRTLSSVAAGADVPRGLNGHLVSCRECSQELRLLREALTLADGQLRELMASPPPASFASRVARNVEADRARSAARLRVRTAWAGLAAALALVVAVVAGFIKTFDFDAKDARRAPAVVAASAPAQVMRRPVAEPQPTLAKPRPPADVAPSSRVRAPTESHEVVVPEGQLEALILLARSYPGRGPDPNWPPPSRGISPLRHEPIHTEPIVIAEVEIPQLRLGNPKGES